MRGVLGIAAAAMVMALPFAQAKSEPRHAIAMHGEPALAEDYAHLPYADPDAKRAGASTMRSRVRSTASTRSSFRGLARAASSTSNSATMSSRR